jgi:predicted permease
MRANIGFDADPVLLAQLARSGTDGERDSRRQELLSRLSQLPGVAAVALSGTTPFEPEGLSFGAVTQIDDRQLSGADLPPFEDHSVSREYFRVLGIPLQRGRAFDSSDEPIQEVQPVLINQSAARLLWPGQDPIGRLIHRGETVQRVMGVVGDSRYQRIRTAPSPAIYTLGGNGTVTTLFVRAQGNPARLIPAVRSVVSEVEPGTSMFAASTLRQRVREAASDTRYVTSLLTAFGAVAALLAAIGVYGLLAYSVLERKREFGIRMAVGARRGELVAGVVRQGSKLLAAGLLIGLLAAIAAAGLLRAFLFEIQPGDPPTLAGVVILLTLVGAVATLLPALRAGRVNPVAVLRE